MSAVANSAELNSSFKNRFITWGWLAFLILAPIVLWILPADFFDNGQAICPSKLFFDIECLGCGMTRAVMHFHHFDYDSAIYYNTGVFLVYPALVILTCIWAYKASRKLGLIPLRKA